jgi:hypothetical protein
VERSVTVILTVGLGESQLTWPEWVAVRRQHRATLLDLAEEEPHLIPVFLQRCLREEAARGPERSVGRGAVAHLVAKRY